MAANKKVKTAKGKKTSVKTSRSARSVNAKSGDNDGGSAPSGPPKGNKSAAHARETKVSGVSVVMAASLMAKAAALGANNAGAGPALGQAKAGTPVRFTGTPRPTATDFSAGAAPDYLFGKTS